MTTRASSLGEADPVALAPDARVQLEVRAAVERSVRVAPELHGHRRHRLRDHELTQLADERLALVGRTRPLRRRAVAPRSRLRRRAAAAAAHDPTAHVRAAAAVDQQHVGPELLVDVAVPLGWQRRAGRPEDADRAEVVVATRMQARLAAAHEERGARAHEARLRLLGNTPLPAGIRPDRIAVEHDDRRAHEERGDERVPHHP